MNALIALSLLALGPWLPGQQPSARTTAAPAPGWESLSDAEKIVKLGQVLDKDQKQLQDLQGQLNDPKGEYAVAEAEFKALDARRSAGRKKIQELESAGKLEEAAKLGEDGEALEGEWLVARDRFNLAISERKILQEKLAVVKQRIQQEQQYLSRLQDPAAAAKAKQGPPGEGPPGAGPATASSTSPSATAGSSALATTPPVAGKSDASSISSAAPGGSSPTPSKHLSKHLEQAQEQARAWESKAEEARNRVQILTERLDAICKSADLEQKLLGTARKRADQAQEEQAALARELTKKQGEKAAVEDLLRLQQKIADAEQRLTRARAEMAAAGDHLRDLQNNVSALKTKQAAASKDAEEKQAEADRARRRVAELENPFSLTNLAAWAYQHGPRVALIVLGMLLLGRLGKLVGRRIVRFMAQHGHRGTAEENESRAQTLVSVFRNAASLAVLGGGTLMLLDEVGIPIMPLLGGAAVIGLAVAFGAQNLIRDYFSGFMVLMEDQYGINDVVKIGTVSGTVEKITLRVTVLRDMSGVVHFIPHGTISTVSNLTHGWSQALFDIPVCPAQDVDRAMTVLIDLGRGLRQDPAFAPWILEGPEMLGVDELADKAVMIRFFIKTRPLKQWLVKREMLRRIKHRFDELGIESPFTHHAAAAEHQPVAA
jgi:small conductance mechanosensitive channel